MKIFLSYGHDNHAILAKRIKHDLELEGYNIWLDIERIKGSSDWELEIEQGISSSQWLILLMTEHSIRRPDGVCLDEVSLARYLGKNIAPLMVQNVQPPLCIARLQWIDMQKYFCTETGIINEEYYSKKIEELKNVISGIDKINFEGLFSDLSRCLNPLDNDIYYEYFRKDFYGRKWLFEAYDQWLKDENTSKIFWVTGQAGIGKTAFVANLCERRQEVVAVHFCKYNDNERSNPKRAIMSIAFHLSTQLPEYRGQIAGLYDLDKLQEKNSKRLFEYLIVEPLLKIKTPAQSYVIIIDALDEATRDGNNDLVDIIAQEFDKTPKWLKGVLTSRSEPLLTRKLSRLSPLIMEEKIFENNEDLYGYYLKMLPFDDVENDKCKIIINNLVKKSQGSFLYAKEIIKEIKNGRLDIDDISNFPEGLTGVYINYFDRLFKENNSFEYRKDFRPLFELLSAFYEPLDLEIICKILDWDEYKIEEVVDAIYMLFPKRNNYIEPIHKSIMDWLIDSMKSGNYRVSKKSGHNKIWEYFYNEYNKKNYSIYAVKYLAKHLIETSNYNSASKVLMNKEVQFKRIDYIGLDSAIREFIREIYSLYKCAPCESMDVLSGDVFIDIMSKHRRYFYNTGIFFDLKACGFDEVIIRDCKKWCMEAQVAVSYYHYITEDFKSAIKSINIILCEIYGNVSDNIKSELHNVIGLCYRKSVEFDVAKKHFEKAEKLSEHDDQLYENSIAKANLAKISYHVLDWNSSDLNNEHAIEALTKAYELSNDPDRKSSLELFIAEYNRLYAESLIWNLDIERASKYLNEARLIYHKNPCRDRYFIRYLYTKTFLKICLGNCDEAVEECRNNIRFATSEYDKAQIEFYAALAHWVRGDSEEIILKHIDMGLNHAEKINAWLEYEEINTLAQIILCDMSKRYKRRASNAENQYISNWLVHVSIFLKKIKEGY